VRNRNYLKITRLLCSETFTEAYLLIVHNDVV